jgi:hypothetical protein
MGSPIDAKYLDDYLREPIPELGERACVRGDKCFGNILPYIKSYPRTVNDATHKVGFTLRELELPIHKAVSDRCGNSTWGAQSFLDDGFQEDFPEEEGDRPEGKKSSRRTDEERKVGGSCALCIMLKQTIKVWQVKQRGRTWPYQIQYFEVVVGPPDGFSEDRLLPEVIPKSGVETGIVKPTLALVVDDYHLSTATRRLPTGREVTVKCYKQTARYFCPASAAHE